MSLFRADVLAGQVALVTGGGGAMCLGIAQTFAQHGAAVVLMGRTQQRLDDGLSKLRSAGVTRAAAVAGDVRKPEDAERAVQTAVSKFGKLSILVVRCSSECAGVIALR